MDYPDSPDLYEGKFTDGDPVAGIPASVASAEHMNAVYDELLNVITFTGGEPDASVRNQLKAALDFYRNANNLNAGTVPTSRLPQIPANKMYGTKALFEKNIMSQPAFQLDAGTLKNAADLTCVVNGVAYEYSEGTGLVLPGSMSIGTDYAIYATPDGLVVSANFTVPDGYTALTSRRVGGFHYQDGEINKFSLYDLKYRPNVRDPRGSARSLLGVWGDIYLLNTTPDLLGTSAHNATIADGSSPPKVPAILGGDGTGQYDDFSQYTAARVLAAFGKRLPNSHEFEAIAFGSTSGYAFGSDPVSTQFDSSARSMIGCEQVSGHMWQWGAERWDRGNGSSGYAWYAGDTNGEGQIYSAGSSGVGASIFGGNWDESGHAGSRASSWSNEPWNSGNNIGARGVCDHFESF